MSNYQSAIKRLKRCKGINEVNQALDGFDRVYNAGFLTESELQRLDAKAFDISMDILDKAYGRDTQ